MSILDLPMITVINNDGCIFSLNNRRLFVLKSIREQGLLPNNEIRVRLKGATSKEILRYTRDRCSLTASLMHEREAVGTDTDDGDVDREGDVHVGSIVDSAVVTESSLSETTLSSKKSKSKASPVASVPLPPVVLQALKGLTRMVEDGKSKKAIQKIQQWINEGVITPEQSSVVNVEIGL